METISPACCGIDVHKAKLTACVLVETTAGKVKKEIRSFGTSTRELGELRDWLTATGVTHVAMESTGIYWRPVYAVLEDAKLSVIIGNAHHIRNVPGRKTDVCDSEWIAMLLRHGLIRPSFVPSKELRELRDLLRYRRKTVEARSAERNRVQKLLETANIKLSSVASSVFSKSGMAMMKALIEGTTTASEMAKLAKGRMRSKVPALELALEGHFEEHHRFILKTQLAHLEHFDSMIASIDTRIDEKIAPYKELRDRYVEIPGIDVLVANTLIAELGPDLSVFDSVRHLAAWCGVAPGNNESAGKRRSARARRGNVFVTTALVEAAQSASAKRNTYYREKYFRLKARRGAKRANMAIANKLLRAVWVIATTRAHYRELGADYFDRRSQKDVERNLVRRLERLGYAVSLSTPQVAETTSIISQN